MFAAVYLLLFLAYEFVTASTASYFGLEATVRVRGISYAASHLWWPHAVKRTFLIGFLFMIFLSLLSFTLFALLRKSYISVRLFFLWSCVLSVSMVSQRLVSTIFSSSFEFRKLGDLGMELSIYGAYMYYKPTTYWFLAILGLLLMVSAGLLLGKPFLQTAWSSEQIGSENNRFVFLRNQLILPFLIGAAIVVALTFPHNLVSNGIGFLCVAVVLVMALVRGMLLGPMPIPKQKRWERWPLVPAVVLAVVVALALTVLRSGVRV